MILGNILNSERIELQDQDSAIYSDDELVRSIEKTISLMTRLLPKRDLIEITLKSAFEQEAIPTSVYAGDTWIKTSTGDIYYAYAAGVTTIAADGWILDNTYTPMYKAANYMMLYIGRDLASTDYIKIERVEFPVDGNPVNYPTFDVVGDYIMFRQKQTFTAGSKVRLVYLKKWTAPTPTEEGDYPTHLDDPIIIGAAGEALIFKAELYTQRALTQADLIVTTLAGLTDITAPTTTASIPALIDVTITGAPTEYTFVKPAKSAVTGITSVPSVPPPDFTAVATALGKIDDWVGYARNGSNGYLDTGSPLINSATRGAEVGATYGKYGDSAINVAMVYVNKSQTLIKELETTLTKYQLDVAAYQSYIQGYAANIAAVVNNFQTEVAAENAGAAVSEAAINLYKAKMDAQGLLLQNFLADVQQYQAQINKFQLDIQNYAAQVNKLTSYAQLLAPTVANYLDISGRYLASGQAKINEFAAMLGVKLEFYTQRAASEQR